MTVLFCDVTGSTALGESMDPEALRALLARYFERMKGIVESHGGTVEKFIGGLLVLAAIVTAVIIVIWSAGGFGGEGTEGLGPSF